MKVTFRSKQRGLSVAYEQLFKCGTDITALGGKFGSNNDDRAHFRGTEEQWELLQAQPDYKKVGSSYVFIEGKRSNELVLEDPVVIKAMRAYIKSRGDNLIVELDEDGNDPTEPEGTPFVAKEADFVLYPAMYKGMTTASGGKTFRFNMGADGNKYITSDPEEIATLRRYIHSHANCSIADPTYKAPFAEEVVERG